MNVLMIGCGEYTVGILPSDGECNTDKKLGVIALTLLDLRSNHKIKWLGLCGRSQNKVERSVEWLKSGIGKKYKNINVVIDESWPKSGSSDLSYQQAIDSLPALSAVTIFTPDDTHFDIALYAIRKKMHVIIAKPAVQTSKQHSILIQEAKKNSVLVCVEFHKRFDPIYIDARDQIRSSSFGDFGYFYSYMSQPKYQLETFRSWAGVQSDISFYLNAHHIDFLLWSIKGRYIPISVVAMSSKGVASSPPYNCVNGTEDTITLMVQFRNLHFPEKISTGIFTSSWTAPNLAECHSQQRFQCLGSKAEVSVDQAHRGYQVTTDSTGFSSRNPLFMKYTPSDNGNFIGQNGYGYQSISKWIDSCILLNNGQAIDELEVATIEDTFDVTCILEAGRKSLDYGSVLVKLESYHEPEGK